MGPVSRAVAIQRRARARPVCFMFCVGVHFGIPCTCFFEFFSLSFVCSGKEFNLKLKGFCEDLFFAPSLP